MVKSETHLDTETLVRKSETETNHARLKDQNKCSINETWGLYAKAVEISRLDEKFETQDFRGTIRHPYWVPL